MNITQTKNKRNFRFQEILIQYLPVIFLLFVFLVGVQSLSASFKMMGAGFTKTLLNNTANPFIALMSGVLATVAVQSSSVTTAIIVGMVSAGTLTVGGAVPMIMGANLGTSVTNTLVSLGYGGDRKSFARAFAAGTIHDSFNILGVLVILPLELMTGFLDKSAAYIATAIYGVGSSVQFNSPLKAAIKPVVKSIKYLITDIFGLKATMAAGTMAFLSALIILFSLAFIVKVTKKIVESSKGEILERLLSRNAFTTIFFGTILTFAVQSSSITTSLLVPLAASGLLSLEAIFPVTVGANIGTTTTALLASLTGNVHGLTIAVVHLLFNVLSTLIWYVPTPMRQVPLAMSRKISQLCEKKRRYGFAYVATVFFILPALFAVIVPLFS